MYITLEENANKHKQFCFSGEQVDKLHTKDTSFSPTV